MTRNATIGSLALILVLAVAAPLLPQWLIFPLGISLAHGIVASGLVIVMRSGNLSFGQGLFYCAGGYVAGLAVSGELSWGAVSGLLLASIVGTALAALTGAFLSRFRGIFFAILTLAFSMVLYGLLLGISTTGGSDGFSVSNPAILGIAPGDRQVFAYYYLALAFAVVTGLFLHIYVKSTLGVASQALGCNEIRVHYLGGWVAGIHWANFVIAGALAAAGGGLYVFITGHAAPEMAYWTSSGEFIFIAVLAGTRSIPAVYVAAIVLEAIRFVASTRFPYTWEAITGVVILFIILFAPNGISALSWRTFSVPRTGHVDRKAKQ